jgi:asparagine synthase (glutamine-hydrolysing)
MHLSEPHLLAVSQMAKPAVKCYFLVKVPMSWWVVIRAKSLTTSISSEFYYHLNFDFFSNHCTINCCALLKFKKSDLVFLMVRISIKGYCNHFWIENTHKRIPKKIYEEAKSLYPGSFRQALYFDQHTYLCSLLDRNDRCTMGASIEW